MYFGFLLGRLLGLVVLLIGWDMSNSHGWRYAAGLAVFIAGVEIFDYFCRRAENRRLMPYRWRCQICKNKGVKFGAQASVEEVVHHVRDNHLRTTHLMEP